MIDSKQIIKVITVLFEDIWNKQDVKKMSDVFSEGLLIHDSDNLINGRENFRSIVENFLRAFPTFQYSIDEMITDNNKAAVRWSGSGRHESEFCGKDATDKILQYSGITIFHFDEQVKVVECWVASNIVEKLNVLFSG